MADGMQEIKPEIVEESPIRWSETIEEFAKALPKAQKALKRLEPDSTNKHLSRDYASLGAALEACLDAYNDNGFSVLQIPTARGELVCVTTRIMHESAEFLEADLVLRPESQTAQKIGTAQTYAKRYMLTSVAGLAVAEETPTATEAVAEAKKEGKRLTKAQARDLFAKLQDGLRHQRSARAVTKWLEHFECELGQLPEDQEKELRNEAAQEIEAHESAKTPELEGAGF